MNRFYSYIEKQLFFGSLKDSHIENIENILRHWELSSYKDLRWLAYMLGTTFHETAFTMRPIEEYGRGKGLPYGRKIKQSGERYSYPDELYYGRGYVQLTWYENYERFGKLLGVSLLERPSLALDKDISAKILIEGMARGLFTGVGLSKYFNDDKSDWRNARRVVNGIDRAQTVAEYAKVFYEALLQGK